MNNILNGLTSIFQGKSERIKLPIAFITTFPFVIIWITQNRMAQPELSFKTISIQWISVVYLNLHTNAHEDHFNARFTSLINMQYHVFVRKTKEP